MMIDVKTQAGGLNLRPDTVLCADNSYTLNAGTGFKTYSWSPDIGTDSLAKICTPRIYKLKVTDFCNNTFTGSLIIRPATFVFSAGADTIKCNKDVVSLTATPGFLNYSWQPAYNLQSITPAKVKVSPTTDTSYMVQAEKWLVVLSGILFKFR